MTKRKPVIVWKGGFHLNQGEWGQTQYSGDYHGRPCAFIILTDMRPFYPADWKESHIFIDLTNTDVAKRPQWATEKELCAQIDKELKVSRVPTVKPRRKQPSSSA